MSRPGQVIWLGEGVDYRATWDLQWRLAAQRGDGLVPDTLLLLEHSPVYTAGRRAVPEHVLAELGAPLVETDRGGQTTYHGPGQLVGYPIVSLRELGLGPRGYVAALEGAIIDTLGAMGIKAWCEDGLTAVWTAQGKVAAIGVKISRGVTLHGFALNVTTDLSAYDAIVPCGITGRHVASMASPGLGIPSMNEVRHLITNALTRRLGIEWEPAPSAAPPTEAEAALRAGSHD